MRATPADPAAVLSVSYPDQAQLHTIYAEYVAALATSTPLDTHPKWSQTSQTTELAKTMVAVYEAVKKAYTVDKKSHYIFTPRELTSWVVNLHRRALHTVALPSGLQLA